MYKFFLVLFLFALTLNAESITWVKTFPKATFAAQNMEKPIFFVLTDSKKDITKLIDKDKNAAVLINKNFIALVSYKDKSDFIPSSILSPTAPSVWFLAPSGNMMYQQDSYDGQSDLHTLSRTLTTVLNDMKNAREEMKLSQLPYKLHVPFKYYTNLEEAEKVSKATKKPIFMLIGRSACQYCRKLKKEVLSDKIILKSLEKEFVVLVHDANYPVSRRYQTPGIPAIWFLTSDGQPYAQPLVGLVPKARLTKAMSNAKLEFKK